MASTITEKILAAAVGQSFVKPDEVIEAAVSVALANDATAPLAIAEFEKAGFERVFDPKRVVLVADHFTPNKDIGAAEQARVMRKFAQRQGITNYFEVGRMGIEHVLLPEAGLIAPGEVVIGADSHTCTYGALAVFSTGVGSTDLAAAMAWGRVWLRVPESMRLVYRGELAPDVTGKDLILHTIGRLGVDGATYRALEFGGDAIAAMSMASRFTMCNMAVEAGAKSAIVGHDETTAAYLTARPLDSRAHVFGRLFASDPDARYSEVVEIDASAVRPTVSRPYSPANTALAEDLAETAIDQVVIGCCTNGRLEDLRQAAEVLRGRHVHPRVRLIVLPGSQRVVLDAAQEGTMQALIEAGAAFSTPTCGPCLGRSHGHPGFRRALR